MSKDVLKFMFGRPIRRNAFRRTFLDVFNEIFCEIAKGEDTSHGITARWDEAKVFAAIQEYKEYFDSAAATKRTKR